MLKQVCIQQEAIPTAKGLEAAVCSLYSLLLIFYVLRKRTFPQGPANPEFKEQSLRQVVVCFDRVCTFLFVSGRPDST